MPPPTSDESIAGDEQTTSRPASVAVANLAAVTEELARASILLVATDFDGTLAPIVDDPATARPQRESVIALRALAAVPNTSVAVISGRSLGDLAEMTGLRGVDESVMLVGSHGSEFDHDFAGTLSAEQTELRTRVLAEMERIASRDRHFRIESKPASIAFHFRNVDDAMAESAVRELVDGAATWPGVESKFGKKVLELAVIHTSKGDAIDAIRQRVGATAVIYLGDDVTDEDAFARLHGPDVGVKVGEGASAAQHRVEGPGDVARLLARLVELRRAWLSGGSAAPIERHALLSDGRVMALVAPGARVTWMCVPRLDGPAIFAELLGGPTAGHFAVEPADLSRDEAVAQSRERYDGDSLVVRTDWPQLRVVDFLDCSGGKPTQRAGRTDLIRIIEGRGEARITFAPRLDFGRTATRLALREGGLEIEDTVDPIVLRAPDVEWTLHEEGMHQTAVGTVKLRGEPVRLELRYGTGSMRERSEASFGERYRLTKAYWESWAERLELPNRERDLVRRSALTLRALRYGPTGAIAAAATTSLPEHLGGIRNWDYRYCWIRDGAMAATALVKLGSFVEAMDFLDWMLGVLDETPSPERLMPLYTLTGHEVGAEAEIGGLAGYAGSRPVRVGNAARGQVQLDVFGPIVELVWQLLIAEAPISSEHWRLVSALVDAVRNRWHEPDHGIWEIRAPRRPHGHSKIMCWLTVDRAIRISESFLERNRPDWTDLRDTIARDILEHAWNPTIGAFTAAYDADDLDAAVLMIGLSGMIDGRDERFAQTVAAIEHTLRDGPTVYRYRGEDGLPGSEGGFFICASWLVESLLLLGRRDDAEELFGQLVDLAGPTGLYPEQYDPRARITLGNHPQAYSHIGIIENALALSRRER